MIPAQLFGGPGDGMRFHVENAGILTFRMSLYRKQSIIEAVSEESHSLRTVIYELDHVCGEPRSNDVGELIYSYRGIQET